YSAAGLDQRAAAGVGNNTAHRGREIVAADGELFRAQLESSPALDRACRHPPSRQGGYVEYTSGVGDQARIPAGGAVGENGDTTGVGDYGGVAGGARIAKRKVRLVADDKSRCVGRIVNDAGTGDVD